jgi:hypothetical protein
MISPSASIDEEKRLITSILLTLLVNTEGKRRRMDWYTAESIHKTTIVKEETYTTVDVVDKGIDTVVDKDYLFAYCRIFPCALLLRASRVPENPTHQGGTHNSTPYSHHTVLFVY